MRQRIVIGVAALLAASAILSNAVITGSKHDFSNASGNWARGEICLPCHAPHNNLNAATTLLWNHAPATGAGYTFYSSPSMKAATPTSMSPISLTCMSCHDGTVALDSFGGATGSRFISTTNNLGIPQYNDHPVSILYSTAALASPTKYAAATASSGMPGGGTIDSDLLYGVAGARKVECNSCHDVHNTFAITGMLKKSNAGSGLCLTCHTL